MKEIINKEELMNGILKAIRSIHYGYVQIIIQDSKVVQIDKTEKIRFERSKKEVRSEE